MIRAGLSALYDAAGKQGFNIMDATIPLVHDIIPKLTVDTEAESGNVWNRNALWRCFTSQAMPTELKNFTASVGASGINYLDHLARTTLKTPLQTLRTAQQKGTALTWPKTISMPEATAARLRNEITMACSFAQAAQLEATAVAICDVGGIQAL